MADTPINPNIHLDNDLLGKSYHAAVKFFHDDFPDAAKLYIIAGDQDQIVDPLQVRPLDLVRGERQRTSSQQLQAAHDACSTDQVISTALSQSGAAHYQTTYLLQAQPYLTVEYRLCNTPDSALQCTVAGNQDHVTTDLVQGWLWHSQRPVLPTGLPGLSPRLLKPMYMTVCMRFITTHVVAG